MQEVGREGLLYDREGKLVHILNSTGLEIWKACDGGNDMAAIEAILRRTFTGMEGCNVRQDIESMLAHLEARGLLERSV